MFTGQWALQMMQLVLAHPVSLQVWARPHLQKHSETLWKCKTLDLTAHPESESPGQGVRPRQKTPLGGLCGTVSVRATTSKNEPFVGREDERWEGRDRAKRPEPLMGHVLPPSELQLSPETGALLAPGRKGAVNAL